MISSQFLIQDRLKLANTTHDWFYVDEQKRYKEAVKSGNTSYGPGDFVYKFNNRGFRCDDFESYNNYDFRMLFVGSSDTEGVGVPLEVTWAKQFHNMVCNKLGIETPFWSISHGAASTDHIVKHLYLEGPTLKPHVVISYVPFLERRERWSGDHWGPWDVTTKENKALASIFLRDSYIRYQTEKNFAFINLLMEQWNSLFLYTLTDKDVDYSYIDFPRFKHVSHFLDYTDKSRDGYHAGPQSHKLFAEQMFESLMPFIQEKYNARS